MRKIFIGLIFILLNFNLTLGNQYVINLIPNFIGFFLIAKGCGHLFEQTRIQEYQETQKLSFILTGISFLSFIGDLMGIGSINQLFATLIGIFNLVLLLYLLYRLTKSIINTQEFNLPEYLTTQLNNAFKWIVIANILAYLMIFFPLLAIIILLVALVAHILYIITIHKISKEIQPHYL